MMLPEGADRPFFPPGEGRVEVYDTGPLGPEEEWMFGRDDKGNTVALNPPPKVVRMSVELVDGDPVRFPSSLNDPIQRRGRLVRVKTVNCRAVYRIAAWDVGNGTYVCRLARVFAYFPVAEA